MNYDDLKPGPDLDAMVAEKVFGIVWDEKRCRVCGWPLMTRVEDGCVPDNCSLRPSPDTTATQHAPYSTDMAYAWSIVEKLGEELTDVYIEKAGLNWYFSTPLGVAGAPSPALAICRAALKVASERAKVAS